MNFRKFFCKLFKRNSWLWKACDCQRYIEKITLEICNESHLIANEYCPATTLVTFEKGTEVNLPCITHKKPIEPPPPPPKDKLSEDIRYRNCGKYFGAFFMPSLLIIRGDVTPIDEAWFRGFVDRVAKEDLSNVIRMIPWGVWWPIAETNPVLLKPHPVRNGKYVLEEIDPQWEDQVFSRLEYVADKGILPQIDMIDNCQFHNPDPWHWHWLYPDNNHGYNGTKLHWFSGIYTHHYEWAYFGQPWIDEYQRLYGTTPTSEADLKPDDYAFMLACRAVGEYFRTLCRWFIEECTRRLGVGNFLLGHNEIDAGEGWHSWMEKNVYGPCGIPSVDVITSGYDDFLRDKQFSRRFTPCLHGVYTLTEYEQKKAEFITFSPERWVVSGDGQLWSATYAATPAWAHDDIRALSARAFRELKGMERNQQDAYPLESMDWTGAEIMRDELRAVLD